MVHEREWRQTWQQRWPWLILAGLLVLFFTFGALFAYHTNKFNAPDERMHFYNIRTVAQTGRMPLFTEKKVAKEAHQPPLYYWVMTPAYWLTADWSEKQQVFGMRLVTLALSSGVIVFTFLMARLVFSRQQVFGERQFLAKEPARTARLESSWPALIAAAVVALNPQFIFMSGVVNNDAMANVTSAALLYAMVWLLTRMSVKDSSAYHLSGTVWLSALFAVGFLSKVHVWPIVGLVAGVFVILEWRELRLRRQRQFGTRQFVRQLTLVLVPVGLAAVWWFSRNIFLYGEPTVYTLMYDRWYEEQHRDFVLAGGWRLSGLREWAMTMFETFWARFGYFNLALPRVYYTVVKALTLAAIGGGAVWLGRSWKSFTRPDRLMWGAIGVAVLGVLAMVFIFNVSFYQPQGRYLFPVIAVLGIYYAVGWTALLPRWLVPTVFGATSVWFVYMNWTSLQIIAR